MQGENISSLIPVGAAEKQTKGTQRKTARHAGGIRTRGSLLHMYVLPGGQPASTPMPIPAFNSSGSSLPRITNYYGGPDPTHILL